MNRLQSIVLAIFLATLAACSGPANVPVPETNRTLAVVPGAPNFDMEAVAVYEGGETGIEVVTAIPYESLQYLNRGENYEASYELFVRVLSPGSRSAAVETVFTDTLVTTSYDSTRSFDRIYRRDRIALPPGSYTVELALEDSESGARAVRSQDVEIADVPSGEILLSDVQLRASRFGGNLEPVVSLHLPSGYDSLMASAELYNLPARAEATLTLLRFQSDTSVAAPPYFFTPGPFTMPYIGVEYDRGDTIQVSRRNLAGAGDRVSIEFLLPALEKGNYQVALNVNSEDLAHTSSRHFAVMREGFPMISGLDEMVESVRYIARDNEWANMMKVSTAEEKKSLFDAFWAGIVPNKEAAASLLETYYSRVEEANVLFSNHKEGWKTDRGMVYIVFGAPPYTEEHHLRRDWYYFEQGFPISRRLPPFVFKRSTAYGLGGLFENYVLQRAPDYEHEWRQRVEKWRDGISM